jgi:hypothetical protein
VACDNFATSGDATATTPAFTVLVAQRPLPATVTTVDITARVVAAGAGPHATGISFYYQFFDANLASTGSGVLGAVAAGGSSLFSVSAPAGSRYVNISANSPTANTDEAFLLGEVQCTAGASDYCAYGTRPQGSTVKGVIITTALLDAMLIATGVGAIWITLFDGFIGSVLWGGDLCDGLPPPFPVFTDADFVQDAPNVVDQRSRDKWWQALLATAWPYFCECVPGPPLSTPFVPPPLPRPDVPDAAPPNPVLIVCDDGDLCTALNSLARQMRALSATVQATLSITTLTQRQGVPFAYLRGAVHAGLSGSGDFAVQGILGLEVSYSSIPSSSDPSAGDPDTYHQIGKISLGTVDGWRRSWMPTHNPYLIFPLSGAFTKVGYTFPLGAVATITELLRES